MKISEAWSLYEADKRLMGYSPYTLKAYSLQAKLLIKFLGDKNIEEIQFLELKNYLTNQSHLKSTSIGHRIRFIKSFFKWAQDEGYIIQNPSAKLKEPKEAKRIPKAMKEEDIEILRMGCKTPLENSILEFMYSTGCRIGEVVRLNRNSIDWANRSVIVFGKGSKEREVYFSIRAEIWLKMYLNSRKDTDIALFVTERSPHRMSIAEMRYILKRIAKRAGLQENIYPHKLRHTFATHLLNNGAPLELIQSYLGHSKIETTMLYAQLSGPRRKELYQRYF